MSTRCTWMYSLQLCYPHSYQSNIGMAKRKQHESSEEESASESEIEQKKPISVCCHFDAFATRLSFNIAAEIKKSDARLRKRRAR